MEGSSYLMSMAAEKEAILAGRKGPPVWLRNGLQPLPGGRDLGLVALRQLWLPYGNRTIFRAAAGSFLSIFEVLG